MNKAFHCVAYQIALLTRTAQCHHLFLIIIDEKNKMTRKHFPFINGLSSIDFVRCCLIERDKVFLCFEK